jgi:hypothetical protein
VIRTDAAAGPELVAQRLRLVQSVPELGVVGPSIRSGAPVALAIGRQLGVGARTPAVFGASLEDGVSAGGDSVLARGFLPCARADAWLIWKKDG